MGIAVEPAFIEQEQEQEQELRGIGAPRIRHSKFPLDNPSPKAHVRANMAPLTGRQQQVLTYITDSLNRTGVIPSTREIQEHFGFASQTSAMQHLRALERRGAIQRHAHKARAVALVSHLKREPIADIPIYGSIAAGMAETVEQESVGSIAMDQATLGVSADRGAFALKVRGESMIDAQISDGDLAILEPREPRNGDIVAALIDGETTLKRYIVQRGKPFLRAENPDFPDLIPAVELVVQGVLVALVRKYRH
jgi:repressor LexA